MVRLLMLLSIPFALSGGAPAASQDATQLQDAGKLFAQRCAECHGARARGDARCRTRNSGANGWRGFCRRITRHPRLSVRLSLRISSHR
jgi:hypothetical protein